MRAAIVDDEPLARALLRRLLVARGVDIVAEAGDGDTAVRAIADARPDVAFLDIELPGRDGFAVLAGLATPPAVVFVTAHPRYAVQAFEVAAVDYLCKPFDDERLAVALERARRRLADPGELRRGIAELARTVGGRLSVREADATRLVPFDQIECIEVSGKYADVHTVRGSHTTREPLAAIEQRLDDRFLRIHRATIVNVDLVVAVRPYAAGDQQLQLASGRRVVTGRLYRAHVIARLGL
ncbi:MAG: response regulator transcription factor [Deltaproteobacteria bacterium]|nr:response regulator transcription factor [Deltaproteobacteria bacterium]